MAKQDGWAQVVLKIDPDHLAIVDAAAEELGMSRASFVRFVVLREARKVFATNLVNE